MRYAGPQKPAEGYFQISVASLEIAEMLAHQRVKHSPIIHRQAVPSLSIHDINWDLYPWLILWRCNPSLLNLAEAAISGFAIGLNH
jgi:hypothetical protein